MDVARPPGPAYPLVSALALVALCAADFAVVPGARPWLALAAVGCLAAVVGAAQGLCWRLAHALLRRAPRALQLLVWPALGLGAGLVVAHKLGAFARFSGPYRTLAIQVLVAGVVGGLGLGALAAAMQPGRERPALLLRPRRRYRVLMCVVLGAACAGAFVVDHTRYVGLYPVAHAALRWSGLWLAMFAFALVPEWLRWPVRGRGLAAALLVALAFAPSLALGPERPQELYAINQRPWPGDLLRVSHRLLDFDRDGYSAWLGGGDCDNFNAAVHPGAREIPDNGLDDNCVLGDGRTQRARSANIPEATEPAPVDVVLITIEALRPDHIGTFNAAYGPKGRNTTPNLDAWARDAVVFHNAFAPGAWTIISLSSMMRGLYARRLKWDPFYETDKFRLLPASPAPALAPGETLLHFFPIPASDTHPTLAELLHRRGMHTMAVVDDGFSAMLQPGNGLSRGFRRYQYSDQASDNPDPHSIRRARRSLDKWGPEHRFFLWIHLFGTHYPNEVHAEVPSYGPSMADGYDHELRYVDLQLRDLFAALEKRNPQPVVVVTGDHGETIAPWMRSHGFGLDEPTMRVPLMIRVPGQPGRHVDNTVSLVDVFPTLLALTKTPGPEPIDGVDLSPILRGGAGPSSRFVITDCWRYAPDRKPYLDMLGASDGKRVLFYDRGNGMVTSLGMPGVPGYALPARAAMNDPLARFALGYTEEVVADPVAEPRADSR